MEIKTESERRETVLDSNQNFLINKLIFLVMYKSFLYGIPNKQASKKIKMLDARIQSDN